MSARDNIAELRAVHETLNQEIDDLEAQLRADLQEGFRIRAEMADWEGTFADARKFLRVDGWLWRINLWCEGKARTERLKAQAVIDEINAALRFGGVRRG